MADNYKRNWEKFRDQQLITVALLLQKLGFVLDEKQVHIGGERYLSGDKKLVLLGQRTSDNKKVIIKVSNDKAMIREIDSEWNARKILSKIDFAYHVFSSPAEILYTKKQDYTILVTEFIEQKISFLERPLQDQFFIALKIFESQEAVHATTHEHAKLIAKTFGIWTADTYLKKLNENSYNIEQALVDKPELNKLLQNLRNFFQSNLVVIDLYANFLTHWDLVPHNFRVRGNELYLLDHSSIRFGNKYEGWARFINFMTLHNGQLAELLLKYIKDNRNKSEYLVLRLMRLFRLTELIWYYTNTLENAVGDHKILNKKRIDLWINVLSSVLEDKLVDNHFIEEYKQERDNLRSEEEKQRQIGLH
ncbi:MAG: hypothetical protein WCS88_04840 [Patescibacteria group bacterium]|jgi:hypothetical protein